MNPPNKDLSPEEREQRREWKRRFKRQKKINKLRTRLQNLQTRSEKGYSSSYENNLIKETARELENLLQLRDDEGTFAGPSDGRSDDDHGHDDRWTSDSYRGERVARRTVERIYQKLQVLLDEEDHKGRVVEGSSMSKLHVHCNHDSCESLRERPDQAKIPEKELVREQRTEQARALLHHMTQGTQSIDMFENADALRGYTRQKFIERAMLVIQSLGRLVTSDGRSSVGDTVSPNSNLKSYDDTNMEMRVVQRLKSVRTVCSIGSGPGSEVVGFSCFLQSLHDDASQFGLSKVSGLGAEALDGQTVSDDLLSQNGFQLDQMIFLDWAMEHWKNILMPLRELMVPLYTKRVYMGVCDVRRALVSGPKADNFGAYNLLSSSVEGGPANPYVEIDWRGREIESCQRSAHGECNANEGPRYLQVDLIIVSYLLSETRGKWDIFFDDVVRLSRSGTIFLITDPTAWQLRIFLDRYSNCTESSNGLDYIWLDSSMNHPELQGLERRVGPGVLLCIKK